MQKSHLFIVILLGSIMALGPLSIDMYLPAFESIAASLGVNTAQVGYSLTSYFVGLLVGQLIYGILIDRYGRKMPLMIGLVIYILACVGIIFSDSLDSLVVFRLFMALGGCSGIVISRAIVRDLFEAQEMAKVFSQLMLVIGVAPIIAPTFGGIINSALGWKWIFGFLICFALLLLVIIFRVLPETKGADASVSLRPKDIGKEYLAVLSKKRFLIYSFAGAFSFAGMFAYISGSPIIFMEHFDLTDRQFAWIFALNALGLIVGSQVNTLVLRQTDERTAAKWSAIVLVVIATVFLVLSYWQWANMIATLCCTISFLFTLGIINPNTQSLALAPFKKEAGRASASLGSIQMGAGVIASALVSYCYQINLPGMPLAMLGCSLISVLLLLLPER